MPQTKLRTNNICGLQGSQSEVMHLVREPRQVNVPSSVIIYDTLQGASIAVQDNCLKYITASDFRA